MFGPAVCTHCDAVTGSPSLVMALAAPVAALTVPLTVSRFQPAVVGVFGHFPIAGFWLNETAAVVVPLPPAHVILKPTWPFLVPGGGVLVVDPVPDLSVAGVQDENFDAAAPFGVSLPDVTTPHVTCDVPAASADVMNGTAMSDAD